MSRRSSALLLLLGLAVARGAAPAESAAPVEVEPTPEAAAKAATEETPPPKPADKPPLGAKKSAPVRGAVALRAARPWSFTATVVPVSLGSALAYQAEDAFSPGILLLTLITTVGVHAAGNLMNTYFDHERGVDTAASSDTTLVSGALTSEQVLELIKRSYGIAAAAALPLLAVSRAPTTPLLLALLLGGGSAFIYTGGPGLKFRALGDVLITATFGPLLVGFSYLAQAGSLGGGVLLAALPLAAHIEAILHANNARDVAEDLASGVRTLASRLGEANSARLYRALITGPFALAAWNCVFGSAVAALPLITAPAAYKLLADFKAGRMAGLPARTAKFQLFFGALTVLGVLLPMPSLSDLLIAWR